MTRKKSAHTSQGQETSLVKPSSLNSGSGSSSGSSSNSSSSGKSSSSSKSSTGTGGTYYSGEYSSGYSSFSSTQMKPTKAFSFDGIQFWGSAKSNLEDILLDDGDLIVNCSGYEYNHKNFVRSQPEWMNLNLAAGCAPHQVLLDWKDFSPPPKNVELSFWKAILEQAKQKGIKRIFCCCMGGQGRTGTALAAFILATEKVNDPEAVIDFVREKYSKNAIESKGQENYLWSLIYGNTEVFGDGADATTKSGSDSKTYGPVPPPPQSVSSSSSAPTHAEEWEAWVEEWGYAVAKPSSEK